MPNAVPMRAAAFVVSGVFWSGLVFLAFTTGLKLPAFTPPFIAEPESIDVLTLPPPPPEAARQTVVTPPRTLEPETPVLTIRDFPVDPAPLDPTPATVPSGAGLVAGPPAPVIVDPRWLSRPGPREFERFYPARAREREKEGRVSLDCLVGVDGALGCRVAHETPAGWGFGDAALRIAPSFKIAPRTEDGRPTAGGTVRVDITFRLGG